MNKITHVWTTTLLLTLANIAVATTKSPADTPQITITSQQQTIIAERVRSVMTKLNLRSNPPNN
jgi:hypothetical protein